MDRRTRLVTSRAVLLAVTLTAAPAGAVDGVIEINDARAVAGGVTPGDSPGYPVTISQRGSYRLTGNLSDGIFLPAPGSVAIDITASDVSLDLNGFTVRHCDDVGIRSSFGSVGVKIYNGIVDSCGVQLSGSSNHVEGLSVGGNIDVTDTSIIRRNRVSGEILCSHCTINENVGVRIQGGHSICTDNTLTNAGAFLTTPPEALDCFPADANLCCAQIPTGPDFCQQCP